MALLLMGVPATAIAALEEVVVTAQKREQSVFEVPASISVFSATDIQESRLERFSDYALRSPNVGFSNPSGDRSDVRFPFAVLGRSPVVVSAILSVCT